MTPSGSDAQVASPAQEALQRAQVLEPERRDVEDRAAVELAAADRRAHYPEAPAAAVEQAEVRDERGERALHERGLVPVSHALVEAAHAPGVRADLGGVVACDDLEAAQPVVPDADRPRPARTAGEEAAEAEVIAHQLDHAVVRIVA